MKDRAAIDTIKGYFYQFDYSIDQILGLPNDNDKIVIEGVEDIDVKTATDELAVQCKYYAKSEYYHSVINAKNFILSFMNFRLYDITGTGTINTGRRRLQRRI